MAKSSWSRVRESNGSATPRQVKARADASIPSKDGVCYFQRLPGEIRNKIYQYALSMSEPIMYRERNRVGKFQVQIKTRQAPNQQRRKKLITQLSKAGMRSPFKDANPLRLVNKQMYYETRALLIRYNDIAIIPARRAPGTTADGTLQCTNFLWNLPSWQLDFIRTLSFDLHLPERITKEDVEECYEKMEPIHRFAEEHQMANIKVYTTLTSEKYKFPYLYMGLWAELGIIFKQDASFAIRMLGDPSGTEVWRLNFMWWTGGNFTRPSEFCAGAWKKPSSSNIRFIPKDKKIDRENHNKSREMYNLNIVSHLKCNWDAWLGIARDMSENGV